MPAGTLACVIKALSLKDAVVLVKRTELLPQVLESAVLDLEHGSRPPVRATDAGAGGRR